MDKETLRKVQMAQLEMAKELRRVCKELKIHFFMDSGTLLGAVRHGGFIPWDDDMDFGMLRKDYETFLNLAPQKLGKGYFLQTWDTDGLYSYPFAKLRKEGTKYVEIVSQHIGIHNELYLAGKKNKGIEIPIYLNVTEINELRGLFLWKIG